MLAPKEKRKERVDWSPNTIAEIDHAKIRNTFFSAPVKDSTTLPTPLEGSKSYKRYPHEMYALPSEDLIRRVVKGDLPDSGSFALTKEEVIQWFEQKWHAKLGTKEKVEEVLERKTQTAKDGTLVWK